MLENILNQRGQVRLLVFFALLAISHLVSFGYNAPEVFDSPDSLLIIALFLLLNAAHIGLLAIFNYFFRHPIVRYILLGVTFEVFLAGGLLVMLQLYGPSSREFFEIFFLVHTQWEVIYFVVMPSLFVASSAVLFELYMGRYYSIEVIRKPDSSILDDIL